jgi:hypothetical protein
MLQGGHAARHLPRREMIRSQVRPAEVGFQCTMLHLGDGDAHSVDNLDERTLTAPLVADPDSFGEYLWTKAVKRSISASVPRIIDRNSGSSFKGHSLATWASIS